MTFARGDFVTLTIGSWTHPAMVTLAAPNGRTLVVMFDGAAPVAGGRLVGVLFLAQEADDIFYDIVTHTAVDLTPRPANGPMLMEGDPWIDADDDVMEDRCAMCDKFLGLGIKALHIGLCEECADLPKQ